LLYFKGYEAHTHQGIVAGFGLHFIKNGIFEKEIGRSLADMLNKRIIGDYDANEIIFLGEAAECITAAEIFFQVCSKYLYNQISEKDSM
jgi:uncharacterized protein (UPF0332 family)